MRELPYWFFTRPHRKLIRVPKTLAAFAGVAGGRQWKGEVAVQKAFEDQLVALDLKRAGDYTERAFGRGGGGGRTHAALLYSLGLYFVHKPAPDMPEEVHLTLAGQALVDQEDALPVLRKQVMSHQFPSPYSMGVGVKDEFRIRPFVFLLKLLRSPQTRGYLTDKEIAACVIGEAKSHSDREVQRIADSIVRFRDEGLAALPDGFEERMQPPGSRGHKSAEELISSSLKDIANTAVQWLRFTGFAVPVPGADYGSDARTVTALNVDLEDEIRSALAEWDRKPLITVLWGLQDPFNRAQTEMAFQRTYGVKAGMVRDNRRIGEIRGMSEHLRTRGLVSAALSHLYATELVTESDPAVVEAVVQHTGLQRDVVEAAVADLLGDSSRGVDSFLDRYEQMAFSGNDEAINFEKATREVLSKVFGLQARHVGQRGTVPDVEVWAEDWAGIIDTKAYAAYDLPQDHQLRMITNYIPAYADGVEERPLRFFMYVSGGFARSFTAKLQTVVDRSGSSGSGIAIQAWRHLIRAYPDSRLTHRDLLELWSCGREISVADVQERLERG
ncbi:restriction endonuclease FokI C-terminal domain-containing protein [Micrococcus endophyticus]|uniref:restriction endonuclease FokI C-terminal domain-containing protein n=1 Tax=Micrococcus endophyticus TaxID=455343 RepID=UPI0034CD546D